MTPQDVLSAAADLIDKRGWHQDDYLGPDGGVCCLGAIQIASFRAQRLFGSDHFAAAKLLSARLGLPAPDAAAAGKQIVEWNDEPGRTQAEVTAALRGAP